MLLQSRWILLYTKPNSEAWAEANLRKQGYETLLPRVRTRGCTVPLFPRYVFAAYDGEVMPRALESTFGVQSVVRMGAQPARVPSDVIVEIRERMNSHGIVTLDQDSGAGTNSLLAARQKDRLIALEQFAAAGFRVRAA